MPKKVLLVNMGSLGDLHPFMGLAIELQKQGAQVLLVSGESYREYIESFGIPFASARPNLHPTNTEILDAVLDRVRGPRRLHKDFVFKHIRETYEDVSKLAEGFDVIVAGVLCFFAPTLSEVKKIPWVSVNLSPVLLWSAYDVPVIPQLPSFRKFLEKMGPRFTKWWLDWTLKSINPWADELHKLRRELSLPKSKGLYRGMMDSPHLNLILFSQHFAQSQPDWPKPFLQAGFVDFDGREKESDPALEKFLRDGEAPVLYTLGSTASELPGSLLDTFIESASLIQERALFVVGAQSAEAHKKLNSSKTFFASYVPYRKIMPRCKVIVHQGGVGTTAQGLRSGNPSLIVADVNDQPDNGWHLALTGAGDWIQRRHATPQKIAERVHDLATSESHKAQAKKIAALLQPENAAQNAAQKILSL